MQRRTSPRAEPTITSAATASTTDSAKRRLPDSSGRQPEIREADSSLPTGQDREQDTAPLSERDDRDRRPGRFFDREQRPRRDAEGLAVKGRGAIRFNSRRSETPPHWKSQGGFYGRPQDNRAGYVR